MSLTRLISLFYPVNVNQLLPAEFTFDPWPAICRLIKLVYISSRQCTGRLFSSIDTPVPPPHRNEFLIHMA